MDYLETFEPLHEFDPDELDHVLNQIWHDLEVIFTTDGLSPKEVEEIGNSSSSMLKILIHTLKKSLIFFYPGRSEEILELVNVNQATKYKYLLLDSGQYFDPLNEGADALVKLYSFIGPYYGHFPLSREEMEQEQTDFAEMKLSLKNYFISAAHFFHNRKMKEAKPLIDEGVKRLKQLHAKKNKKNKHVLEYCQQLMEIKKSPSAQRLFIRFPNCEKKAATINGARIFREETEDGEEKVICIMPDGRRREIGQRPFNDYFQYVKKILNVNS